MAFSRQMTDTALFAYIQRPITHSRNLRNISREFNSHINVNGGILRDMDFEWSL
jgi:hypothetical protein